MKRIAYTKAIFTYLAFALLVVIGHIRDQLGKIFHYKKYRRYFVENNLSPLFTTFESFYIRRFYRRISDCWNRPISSSPGKNITVLERTSTDNKMTFNLTGETVRALNFSSYNYLGFADSKSNESVDLLRTLRENSMDVCSSLPPACCDTLVIKELEEKVAEFLYKEDCIVFQMGYGTNTLNMSCFMKDALVLSDEYNHTSIINGLKATASKVVVYKHNDMVDLEKKLRFFISQGVPVTHRAWKKIFVAIEGLFSMEGTIPNLTKIQELKDKYKFYVFMDEAHSFGSIGKTGRGVVEMFNGDFDLIDVHMGTFTKSLGSYGGFIAASKPIVNKLRVESAFNLFSDPMSPIVALKSLKNLEKIIKDPSPIKKLTNNTVYARKEFTSHGFDPLGHPHSPVIPILIVNPGKMGEFSRLCLNQGIAVVVVGYPATPLLLGRCRICISCVHTHDEIDHMIKVIDTIGTLLGIK